LIVFKGWTVKHLLAVRVNEKDHSLDGDLLEPPLPTLEIAEVGRV